MTIYALVSENSPIRLWGLDSRQRLQRQLRAISKENPKDFSNIHWLKNADDAPGNGRILLLNGTFLFENRAGESGYGAFAYLGWLLLGSVTSYATAFWLFKSRDLPAPI